MPHPPRLSATEVRVLAALAETRAVREAAERLNMSASALSRALAAAEARLGLRLYQRGWSGAEPTAGGELVIGPCQGILAELDRADRGGLGSPAAPGRLAAFVRWRHLAAVAEVVRTGSATAAAQALGIRQPAVSQALRDVAGYVAPPLFRRHAAGLAPTFAAGELVVHWQRIAAELDRIPQRLAAMAGVLVGRVAVGMLPFSGQAQVMETFGALSRQHPHLKLLAVPGSYGSLAEALRRGEIDLMLGIGRAPPPWPDFVEEHLCDEDFTMVARSDHPCHSAPPDAAALAAMRWIVAPHGTPVRRYFEHFFRAAGVEPPAQSCEILSFADAEQMIAASDSVALLCYGPAELRRLRPGLRRLEVALPAARAPIVVTSRRTAPPSEAVAVFLALLRARIAAAEAAPG